MRNEKREIQEEARLVDLKIIYVQVKRLESKTSLAISIYMHLHVQYNRLHFCSNTPEKVNRAKQ